MRGFISADMANKNFDSNMKIHKEISDIESKILQISNTGLREIIIDDTDISSPNVNTALTIDSIDLDQNEIEIIGHELEDDDIVLVDSSEDLPSPLQISVFYTVVVVDDDNIRLEPYNENFPEVIELLNEGSGDITIRKITEQEKYFYSWQRFAIFKNSRTFLYILDKVENHFRSLGYTIKRYKYPDNDTLFWKIFW